MRAGIARALVPSRVRYHRPHVVAGPSEAPPRSRLRKATTTMRILVLGGGPGGYSAAFEAARLGAEVTLVEKEHLGGTCLNWGCIPTKTILRSARIAARRAQRGRVRPASRPRRTVDVERAAGAQGGHRRRAARAARGDRDAPQGRGRLRRGPARRARRRSRSTADGEHATTRPTRVILATGSVVFKLPEHRPRARAASGRATRRSRSSTIPERVLHHRRRRHRAGVRVRLRGVRQRGARRRAHAHGAARQRQARAARLPRPRSRRMGVRFHLGDAGRRRVEQYGETMAHHAARTARSSRRDIVLSAVGRMPNSDGLGFAEAGHRDGPRGRQGRRVPPHERAGRLRDRRPHRRHDARARRRRGGRRGGAQRGARARRPRAPSRIPSSSRRLLVPSRRASTRSPRSASSGRTRDGAKERGLDAVQAVAKFAANGKALGEGEADGFVQIVAEKGTGPDRRLPDRRAARRRDRSTRSRVAMRNGLTVAATRRDGARASDRLARSSRPPPSTRRASAGCSRPLARRVLSSRACPTNTDRDDARRMPAWMRRPLAAPGRAAEVAGLLERAASSTPCATRRKCPNRGECFAVGHGDVPHHGRRTARATAASARSRRARRAPLDPDEPRRVAEAAAAHGPAPRRGHDGHARRPARRRRGSLRRR